MAKDPNVLKGAVKKPPAGAPKHADNQPNAPSAKDKAQKPKLDKSSAEVGGKVVRKDPGAQNRTQPIAEGTVAFEMPTNDVNIDDEAAAFLTDDEPAADEVSDVAQAEPLPSGSTQAFSGATIDTEMPKDVESEVPNAGATQAFGATIDSIETDMPKLVPDDAPAGGATRQISNETIDTEMPKEPAKRPQAPVRKPAGAADAAAAGAQKGTPMASMLGGKYKLLKKIGQGGMGAVYKAHDEKLDRIVAIKVLAKELSGKEAYVARFAREGRVMIKLDHPNVIRCFDIDEDKEKGLHFLAIEFVEGGSVEGWLKKLGKFSIGDALHIVLKASAGLQHAHDKALIHRDVKPDNLLLTKDGIVKVADLGLAKDTDEDVSLTKTGAGAGTPIYMAPEQARDVKHVDSRVDVYALGIMLYVFLTGQPPFQGTTLVELISAKEKGKFDPMRKHNDEVPSKLDLIVDKMIAKDPKNRYASCQAVIDELEPLGLANETLSFIEGLAKPAGPAKSAGAKPVPTKTPNQVAAKTSVGGAGAAPAAKTQAPSSGGNTSLPDEADVRDVWFWQFETPNGKPVTKKLTTEQVRTLIKSGHLDNQARLSKSEKAGFRGAATYKEFEGIFKSLRAATKANSRASSRGKMSDIVEEDERRRKYGWISRMFKGMGSTLFGLMWIVLILAIMGVGGYFLWRYMNP